VEVPDRTAATLQAKIREYILPGSHIISDGWAAYANVSGIGGGIYSHEVVVHENLFVDPDDEEINTQNVENMWMRAKRKFDASVEPVVIYFMFTSSSFETASNQLTRRCFVQTFGWHYTKLSGVITATSCPKMYASRHYRRRHL